jgi:hypothetical protein
VEDKTERSYTLNPTTIALWAAIIYLVHKRQAKQNKIQGNRRQSSYTKYKNTRKLNMAPAFWSVKIGKKAFLAKEYKIFLHSSGEFNNRFYVHARCIEP